MTEHPVFELDSGVRGMLHIGGPCALPVFREFNFIYGVNGSGKTTLAAAIAEAGRESGLRVDVFDRAYVSDVLAEVGDVDPLWVVADAASQLVERSAMLEKRSENLRSALAVSKAEVKVAKSEYGAFLAGIADELRPLRRAATNTYATYSEKEAEEKLTRIDRVEATTNPIDRTEERSIVEQSDLVSLKPFGIGNHQDVLARFLRFLTAADFASLKKAGLQNWASNAVAIASSAVGEPCPFCSQVLTAGAIDHIHSVATQSPTGGEEFEAFRSAFEQVASRSLNSSLPVPGSFHAPLKEQANTALERYSADLEVLAVTLPDIDDALELLADKSADSATDDWIATARSAESALTDLAALVDEHESATEDQRHRKNGAFARYEHSLLWERHERWRELRDAVAQNLANEKLIAEEIKAIEEERDEVDRNIRGQMSPERLNTDLENYLGHAAIRFESIEPQEDAAGYRIVRSSGEPALGLSEGESTAIALLHFLRGCANEDSATPPDLVILDDPVTSLDDSALYTAHAFIQSSLRRNNNSDAPTVVVLTHRHPYFRLLVDWRDKLNIKPSGQDRRDRARLIETFSILAGDERLCTVRAMPEALASSGSEYALLFASLAESSSDNPQADCCRWSEPIEVAIQPNLARRVLEGFLSFKYGGTKRKPPPNLLKAALGDVPDDTFGADREARLWKLLNAASHGEGLVDTYQPIASTTEIQLVVRDVLDLIKILDPVHFKAISGN